MRSRRWRPCFRGALEVHRRSPGQSRRSTPPGIQLITTRPMPHRTGQPRLQARGQRDWSKAATPSARPVREKPLPRSSRARRSRDQRGHGQPAPSAQRKRGVIRRRRVADRRPQQALKNQGSPSTAQSRSSTRGYPGFLRANRRRTRNRNGPVAVIETQQKATRPGSEPNPPKFSRIIARKWTEATAAPIIKCRSVEKPKAILIADPIHHERTPSETEVRLPYALDTSLWIRSGCHQMPIPRGLIQRRSLIRPRFFSILRGKSCRIDDKRIANAPEKCTNACLP